MGAPSDFAWRRLADGTVQISHRGRPVTSLRGDRADAFLAEVDGDPQEVMARWTGQYKRGNERTARRHPRNGGGT